jgi:LysR family glycine cleavage system transcriptional activator
MPDRSLPSLNAVRSFVAVARRLSFTKAAEDLSVTQGAVSRMMQTLHADLGVELFRRVGRGIELTPTGAAFYAEASQALDRIAAAARAARLQDGGVLRVSALPTLAQRWLVPRLKRFQAENPDILVDVSVSEHNVDFAAEPLDIAIRFGVEGWAGADITPLMPETIGVFCAPSLLAQGTPLDHPADLARHRLLQHTTRPDSWRHYLAAFGLTLPESALSLGFEHFFMIIEAASAGMGVALLPVFLVQEDLASGRLVQPIAETLRQRGGYFIAHAPGAERARRIRQFKSWILSESV